MEPVRTIVQTFQKQYPSPYEAAFAYLSVILALNHLHLTPRELQLLAFTASKGSISSGGAKQQFMEQFKCSKAGVGNLIHSLSEKGALVKEGRSIKVIPAFRLDFTRPLALVLKLEKPIPHEQVA